MDKSAARAYVWEKLLHVALPDSRYHFDFNEYIPDFVGSRQAVQKLANLDIYRKSQFTFVTPDNCLEDLRYRLLCENKLTLVSTYGLKRGFLLLDPNQIPQGYHLYASTLDGMERVGIPITLSELKKYSPIELIVTGASAIGLNGVRFGKGHGYFDLEWGMLFDYGLVSENTKIVALVHECQIVDQILEPDKYDSVCDFIVTPSSVIQVQNPYKPKVGVVWEELQPGMIDTIPPLAEMRKLYKPHAE
jgi:5-formyltetrahydrofolate cyclo-ligase